MAAPVRARFAEIRARVDARADAAVAREASAARRVPERGAPIAEAFGGPRCTTCGGALPLGADELLTSEAASLLGLSPARFAALHVEGAIRPVRVVAKINVYRRADVEAIFYRRRYPAGRAHDGR